MFDRMLKSFSARFNLLPCPLCRERDGGGENRFCPECLARLPRITGSRCPGCGGSYDGVLARCPKCLAARERVWLGAAAIFEYRDLARDLIHDFKYHDRPELARPLGELGAELFRQMRFTPEWIVPVPLHWTRRLTRGYNQSELFADELARRIGVPALDALRRVCHGKRQARLKREARWANPRNAFRLRPGMPVGGRRILLVDDVFTTGATLDAAARELLRAGCAGVWVMTIARTGLAAD